MNTLFTANAWERHPPFQSNGAAHIGSDAEMDVSECSNLALPSGCSKDEGVGHDGRPLKESISVLPAAINAVAEADSVRADGAPNVKYGLVVSESNKNGAVVVAHQRITLPGLYEDVQYPVRTLFAPPQPPADMPPRVKRRARPSPVYDNDIATAGEQQHRAQREVSRMWRGVLCRRRLQQARVMEQVLNNRARHIQCWWRSLQARWRRRQLRTIREEWAKERTACYVAARVENTKSMLYWQHCRYEGAAVLIQRMVRRYIREKQRRQCEMEGLPESEWPPALEQLPCKHRPYFPWRRPRCILEAGKHAAAADELAVIDGQALPSRTLLQFRDVKAQVPPPTQEEVEAINAKTRERNAQQALVLTTPESLSRAEWKTENIRQEDLDFNAGVLQRLYRSKQAPVKARTKQLTRDYLERTARIIARTFCMYVLMRRIRARRVRLENHVRARLARRDAERIEALKVAAVWQLELMNASAMCIQRCWHWYRFERSGVVPASYAAKQAVPAPPRYGLIDGHIKRERERQWMTMNLMEKHEIEKRKHMYLRYVPAKTVTYKCTGRFAEAPQA
ncbi:hypothetical protein GH5_07393 [Leishmania sp. Ghana 2012 LV757]|uniref:hypothetical protein n=1 Tax=Leishmania sp. Ghana 2012 LV757 TaxID=2803181 RepID=UPI001B3E914E|nr:hypothetical protein GH5_07393 [Leishmania sp. Ghana 2012 LV757]